MKRPRDISPSEETCDSSNEFKAYADWVNEGYNNDPKRLKTCPPPLSKEKDKSTTDLLASSNSEMSSELITIGSYTLSSPESSSKTHKSHPSPPLLSQHSTTTLSFPATPPPFSSGYDEVMDFSGTARRLFEGPTTKGVFANLKNRLEPVFLKRLKELSGSEATFEVGIEIADLVHLLKLIGSSNRELEILGKKTGKGAFLLHKGVKLVREWQELLSSTMSDMPNSNDKVI